MNIKYLYFNVFWFPFYCCLNECGSGINVCDITMKMPWTKCFEHDCKNFRKKYTLICCGNLSTDVCNKACNVTKEDLIIKEPCAPRCVNGFLDSGKCKCHIGYFGNCCDKCQDTKYCENGGTCSMVGANEKCYCKPGYRGDRCQYKFTTKTTPTTTPTTTTPTTTITPTTTTTPTTITPTTTTPTTTTPTTTTPTTTTPITTKASTTTPTTTILTTTTPPTTTSTTTTHTTTTLTTTTPTTTTLTTTTPTTTTLTTPKSTTTTIRTTIPTTATAPITTSTPTTKPTLTVTSFTPLTMTLTTLLTRTTVTKIPSTSTKLTVSSGLPITITQNMHNTKKTVSSIIIPTTCITSSATGVNSHTATISTTTATVNRNPTTRSTRISQTAHKNDNEICKDDPCLYGECIDQVNGYICECNILFKGKHCTKMKIWAIVCISIAALAVVVTCCFFCLSCNRNFDGNKVIPLKIKPQPYISDYEDQQFNRKKRGPIRPKIWKY